MLIDYGEVQKYDAAKGFGFVNRDFGSLLNPLEASACFYVNEIKHKHPEIVRKLNTGAYSEIKFWYSIKLTTEGAQVNEIWYQSNEIPIQARKEIACCVLEIWKNVYYNPLPFWFHYKTIELYGTEMRDELSRKRNQSIRSQRMKGESYQETSYRLEAKRHESLVRIQISLDKLIDLAHMPNVGELLHEITTELSSIPLKEREGFWCNLPSKIAYGNPIYKLAPSEIRIAVVRKRFDDILKCIEGCVRLPSFQFHWQPKEFYGYLQEEDWKLAREWLRGQSFLSDEQRSYAEARMLSARAAEKVAFSFFSLLEESPEDISITQLSPMSKDWKSHDLLLKNEFPIDVKNSRTSRNQGNYYVEHCVPRFKYTLERHDVYIAGVLSPYIRLEEFRNPKNIKSAGQIIFLGVTRRSIIERLQKGFTTDQLQSIEIEKNPKEEFNVIPPWIFDYPKKFYEEPDVFRERLREFQTSDYPSWEEIKELGVNPFPAIIATGLAIPPDWKESLLPWQRDFCDNIVRLGSRFSLPQLYLNILAHFLKMLSSGESNDSYQPLMYMALLYSDGDFIPVRKAEQKSKHPLGIVDPLNIINNLIVSLQIVWEHRISDKWNLSEFRFFSFKGLGWLVGGTSRSSRSQKTILAYCGGKVGGVPCGKTPLLIGRHKICNRCGHLICDMCDFCSEGCNTNKKR